MQEGNELRPDIPVPSLDGIGEKTFLGSMKLSTRALLFFIFSAFALVSLAGGLYVADKKMIAAHQKLDASKALAGLVATVEKSNWRIRINEKNYLLHKSPKYIDKHKLNINLLSEVLNTLYTHPAAAPVKEHITTINEGLAQYALEFENAISTKGVGGKSNVLAAKLRDSISEVETKVASFGMAPLTNALAAINDSEKAFVNSGSMKDLVKLNKDIDVFTVHLASSKLNEEVKLLVMNLFKPYQGNLSQFAKSRLKRQREVGRLDEIFAYIAPSVNGIVSYAKSNVVKAANDEQELRQVYRFMLPTGGVAIIISIVLFGIVMMRSITDPVREVSIAAKRLAAGDENLVIPALGNKDEMGDTARALFMLKNKFYALSRDEKLGVDVTGGDTSGAVEQLRSELEAARERAQKGDAAMAEATQLRSEIEDLKSNVSGESFNADEQLRRDLDAANENVKKGEQAIAEAAQLRTEIEALKSQADGNAQASAELEQLRSDLEAANENVKKGEQAITETAQLRSEMETLKSQADVNAQATAELEQLRSDLVAANENVKLGEEAIIEMAQLRSEMETLKSQTGDTVQAAAELEQLRTEIESLKSQAGDNVQASAELVQLRSDLDAANELALKGEAAIAEASQLRANLESLNAQVSESAQAPAEDEESDRLRQELEETKKDMAKGEAALIEAALLRIDLDATKDELEKATAQLQSSGADDEVGDASSQDIAVRHDQQPALPGQITTASQQLAKSSQTVSEAAYEAERTGVMIKGLIEATAKVEDVEALLAGIVSQTDFLALPSMGDGEASKEMADSSLVVLTTDYKKASGQESPPSSDENIAQRFDAIRAATNQATWNIKDIAGIIIEVKEVASEIASTSSAEALEITTELLEQSEHLRSMLDNLVTNIQDSTASDDKEES